MSKFRKSAKGQDCMIRIPGHCNFNPETTVLCHLNGGGMGMKHSDIHAAFGCSNCHDIVDNRWATEYKQDQIKLWHLEGMVRTQQHWIKIGLLKA